MSVGKLRAEPLRSGLVALPTHAAFEGNLMCASVLGSGRGIAATHDHTPKPAPPPHRTTLSSLGCASAVAWISGGHTGH
jgi:hypothetical protein